MEGPVESEELLRNVLLYTILLHVESEYYNR